MASNLEDSAPSAVTRGYPPPSSLSTGVAKTSKKPRKPELAAAKSLPPNAFLPLSDFDKDRNNKKEQEIENVMKINDKFDETLRKSPSVPMGLRRHPRYSCDSLSDEEEEKQTVIQRLSLVTPQTARTHNAHEEDAHSTQQSQVALQSHRCVNAEAHCVFRHARTERSYK